MKALITLSLALLVGCGGTSKPLTVDIDQHEGVYLSTDNGQFAVIRVVSVAPAVPSAFIYGKTFSTLADARAAMSDGFPYPTTVVRPTGQIRGALTYSEKTRPHTNRLVLSIQYNPTADNWTGPVYSGTASFDAAGRMLGVASNGTASPEQMVSTWVRQ
jgi:hypothetical protein